MERKSAETGAARPGYSENVRGLINFWEKRLKFSNFPVDPVTSAFIQATIGVLRSLPNQSDENGTWSSPKERYEHITRLIRQGN